ncbi:membrane protein insertion efficiency factor YidD [Pseudonocardia lacus]|uniref:membrane protein insertion efficiency factor YidD n=1 Tax=Pseudonocardia lacus TaxID=2835865 RepID=UPI001BDCCE5C|nr:membrane protein insertion efficiency factor YidD [Pseudonocardia lacus]
MAGEDGAAGEAEEEADRSRCSDGCDGCDLPCDGCELPCDCSLLLSVSTLLRLAAFLAPGRAGRRPVLALLGLYRRRLTRFTPRCPSTPSCSAYAVAAVQDLGARRGLVAAARRVRDCGPRQR